MQVRHHLAIIFAKIVQKVLVLITKGRGSALPGLLVEKFDPGILKFFSSQIPNIVLITGTNGKTTTQKALVSVLRGAGKKVLTNSTGSNMKRGLIAHLIMDSDFNGKLNVDYAVLEVEEATMPKVTGDLSPKHIIVTNLFRDQLDAYGEIDRTKTMIHQAISQAPKAIIIKNADDPKLFDILEGLKNENICFGIEKKYQENFKYEGDSLAKAHCIRADQIEVTEDDLSTKFVLSNHESKNFQYIFPAPGIYNVYNAMAAIISAHMFGISHADINKGLQNMEIAFGRGEIITKGDITFKVLLAKNPAGMNLVLELLSMAEEPKLIFLLNDRIADGKDVSWIWDSNFELLNKINPQIIVCSGKRTWDLVLRIKYIYGSLKKMTDDSYMTPNGITIFVVPNQENLIKFLKSKKLKGLYYLVPTYTAMLGFRKLTLGRELDE